MGTIRLSELFERVSLLRSDLLPEQKNWALVEAARKLAIDTGGLIDKNIPFTLAVGEWSYTMVLPADRIVRSINKIECYDQDMEQWYLLKGPDNNILKRSVPPESQDDAEPYHWVSREADITFECPTDAEMALRAEVSYIPGRHETPDAIEFHHASETAVIAYASHLAFSIAGEGQNLSTAAALLRQYRNELPLICHVKTEGEGASQTVNGWLPYEG